MGDPFARRAAFVISFQVVAGWVLCCKTWIDLIIMWQIYFFFSKWLWSDILIHHLMRLPDFTNSPWLAMAIGIGIAIAKQCSYKPQCDMTLLLSDGTSDCRSARTSHDSNIWLPAGFSIWFCLWETCREHWKLESCDHGSLRHNVEPHAKCLDHGDAAVPGTARTDLNYHLFKAVITLNDCWTSGC